MDIYYLINLYVYIKKKINFYNNFFIFTLNISESLYKILGYIHLH